MPKVINSWKTHCRLSSVICYWLLRLGLFHTLTNRCLRYRKSTNKRCRKVSQLVTPPDVLAVYRIPEYHLNIDTLKKELVLALDTVQDPGNLGTIVRLADWFGIRHIVCSPDTADLYNPKVVQATMGALARVNVYYTSLPDFLSQVDSSVVYGTFLDGEDIYHTSLTKSGVIVMGNEGNGISAKLEPYIGKRLYIPNYPVGQPTSESLNVAVAAAITCAEFRRRQIV